MFYSLKTLKSFFVDCYERFMCILTIQVVHIFSHFLEIFINILKFVSGEIRLHA